RTSGRRISAASRPPGRHRVRIAGAALAHDQRAARCILPLQPAKLRRRTGASMSLMAAVFPVPAEVAGASPGMIAEALAKRALNSGRWLRLEERQSFRLVPARSQRTGGSFRPGTHMVVIAPDGSGESVTISWSRFQPRPDGGPGAWRGPQP